jgi:hypothetical protein
MHGGGPLYEGPGKINQFIFTFHAITWTLMCVFLINWINERTVLSVVEVLDEPYSQVTPLSGVAVPYRPPSRIGNFRQKIIPRKTE